MGQDSINLNSLKPLHELLGSDFPERMREIAEFLFIVLLSDADLQHCEPHKLARLAKTQTLRICAEMGGMNMYLPRMRYDRDHEIWNQFNGTNISELARTFGMTEMRVRQIITDMRHKFAAKYQGRFDFDDTQN